MFGLSDIISKNRVAETTEGQQIKNEHRLHCDHERLFLMDAGYSAGDGHIESKELYQQYREWMIGNNYRPLSAGNFYKRVECLIPTATHKATRIMGALVKAFTGIVKNQEVVTDVTGL
jgi:hypothetical protein